MTVRSRFGTYGVFGATALVAAFLFAHEAKAQKYDDDGTEPAAAAVDDGFRPVWQQQARNKKAHESAKAERKQQVAEKQPEAPMRTETTVYDRWTVTCQEKLAEGAKKICSAALRVTDQNQQLVILWQLNRTADGKVMSVMQTPTGVMVQKGIDLNIGDRKVVQFAYADCMPQNCEGGGTLEDQMIKKFVEASEMMVTVHAKDGRDVHFKFPVTGIDKAMAAVRS